MYPRSDAPCQCPESQGYAESMAKVNKTNNRLEDKPNLRERFVSRSTLLSLGATAILIFVLTTRFDIDWIQTWHNMRSLNPKLYLLAMLLYYIGLYVRSIRWRLLASNANSDTNQSFRLPTKTRFMQLTLIGWFINSIGWFRIGDMYRAYILSNDSRTDFSSGLGVVLAERVMDMTTILLVAVLSVIWYSAESISETTWYFTSIVLASIFMSFVLIASLLVMKTYGSKLARFLPFRFEQLYSQFQQGAFGSFKRLRAIFFLGLGTWILEAARLYLVVEALDMSAPLSLMLVVAVAQAILSVIPITPGGVGFVETGAATLFSFHLESSSAASIALVDRTITYLSVIAVGGASFLFLQISKDRSHTQ